LRVWLRKESIVPQFILKGLDLRVDTRQRDPSEVSKVFANGHVQGVWPIEHVRVGLQVSSERLSHVGAARVEEVGVVEYPSFEHGGSEGCDASRVVKVLKVPQIPGNRDTQEPVRRGKCRLRCILIN
jgi:hypothetical protein